MPTRGRAGVLQQYAALLDRQADTKPMLKAAQAALDAKLDAKYPSSPRTKSRPWWWTTMAGHACGRRAGRTGSRLPDTHQPHPPLADRYAAPLPQLVDEVAGWPPAWRSTSRIWGRHGVRPGYKQTEVGVIPEDWDLHSVDHDFEPMLSHSGSRRMGDILCVISGALCRSRTSNAFAEEYYAAT